MIVELAQDVTLNETSQQASAYPGWTTRLARFPIWTAADGGGRLIESGTNTSWRGTRTIRATREEQIAIARDASMGTTCRASKPHVA